MKTIKRFNLVRVYLKIYFFLAQRGHQASVITKTISFKAFISALPTGGYLRSEIIQVHESTVCPEGPRMNQCWWCEPLNIIPLFTKNPTLIAFTSNTISAVHHNDDVSYLVYAWLSKKSYSKVGAVKDGLGIRRKEGECVERLTSGSFVILGMLYCM